MDGFSYEGILNRLGQFLLTATLKSPKMKIYSKLRGITFLRLIKPTSFLKLAKLNPFHAPEDGLTFSVSLSSNKVLSRYSGTQIHLVPCVIESV